MKRILFSITTRAFLTLTFVSVNVNAQQKSVKSDKPNFIILFADDMGYGDLSTYGNPSIKTPNLDRMAMEGQKWTNFYVGASTCTPSRGALLTGRLPIRTGLEGKNQRVLFPYSKNGMLESEITLAEQLKTVGYNTAAIGKWHLGSKKQYLPTSQGFDYYYGIPYSNDMDIDPEVIAKAGGYWELWKSDARKDIKTFNVPLMRNTTTIEQPAEQHTLTKRYTQEAIKYIDQNKKNPFFVYMAYSFPHVPVFASNDFEGKSKAGAYGDSVEEIDHSVGQILEYLRKTGLDKNTIVVFSSDNGPWIALNTTEGGSAGLLKDGKGSTWEGGMREPGIFWSPGLVKPGMITDIGSTMDFFTTFSKMGGVEVPKDRVIDGVDISETILNGKPSARKDMFYYRQGELFAVRLGAYKAHFITQSSYAKDKKVLDTPLLYNLDTDPSEKFDLASKHPEVIAEIRKLIASHQENLVVGKDLCEELDHNPFAPKK